jgi:hypothetical protein
MAIFGTAEAVPFQNSIYATGSRLLRCRLRLFRELGLLHAFQR